MKAINKTRLLNSELDCIELPFDAIYDVAKMAKAYSVAMLLELALYSHEHGELNPIPWSELESFVPKRKRNRVLRLLLDNGLIEQGEVK
jgi:hypothetical protein